jgi:23S rRNA pseudouridine2605 synthase
LAQVVGVPTSESLAKLERGVHLAEGFAHAERISVRRTHRQSTLLEIVLAEGRNREVRRLLARLGHKVLALRRIAIGPLRLGNLQPGESRPLRQDEVKDLYHAAHTRKKSGRLKGNGPRDLKTSLPGDQRSARRQEKHPAAQPIIDQSLPPELTEDETALNPEFTLAEDFVPEDSQDAQDTTPIDLSPLVPGSRHSRQQRTIIGVEQKRGNQKQTNQKQTNQKQTNQKHRRHSSRRPRRKSRLPRHHNP